MRNLDTDGGTVTLVLPHHPHPLDALLLSATAPPVPERVGANAWEPPARWMYSWTKLSPLLEQFGVLREGKRRGYEKDRATGARLLEDICSDPEAGLGADLATAGVEGVSEVVTAILEELDAEFRLDRPEYAAGWATIDHWKRWIVDGHTSSSLNQTERRMRWLRGLAAPSEVTRSSLVALRSITLSTIETCRTRAVGLPTDETDEELVSRLLPQALVDRKLSSLTPIQREALPYLPELVDLRRSMIVGSPPGVGKTRLGQMAATYATCDPETGVRRESGAKALVLMPTRALIDEQLRAWEDWLDLGDTEPLLRVVGVSAEHDSFRREVVLGEFDVAICVYESAANLLSGPMRSRLLSEISLIIVDEWQWMRDDQRGSQLDALLTGLQVNEERPPPVMLMGPELDHPSHAAAIRWLSATRSVMSDQRVTDLSFHVVSPTTEVKRIETPAGIEEPEQTDRFDPPLDKALGDLEAELRQRLGVLPSRGLPLLLAAKLLREDDRSRIIVFVEERDVAVRCAEVAAALFDDVGVGRVPNGDNPWESGRFPSGCPDLDVEAAHRRLIASSATADDLGRATQWLRNGIAVHTASIEQELQKLFVKELDDGIVRVMFATDTVAEGINVAASHVIVGSTYRGGSGREELLDVQKVRQRVNRAGRLNRWSRGHGYLCVSRRAPSTIVEGAVVTNPAVAFSHFVDGDAQLAVVPGGNTQGSRIDRLAGIALHHLRHRDQPRTREETISEITMFLERTYLAAYSARPIDDEDVREVVDRLEAIEGLEAEAPLPEALLKVLEEKGAVSDEGGRIRVTPLGHVIDSHAFPLRSAGTVQDLVALLTGEEPPCDLDLIAVCATDPTLRNAQIGWSYKRRSDLETSLVASLQSVLKLYAETAREADLEQLRSALASGGGIGRPPVLPHEELFLLWQGRELKAGELLTTLLETDAAVVADVEASAGRRPDLGGHLLLRALLAYEWANFEPRERTLGRIRQHVFGPARERYGVAVPWSAHGPDLRRFARGCAHLLTAAHQLHPRHERLAEKLAARLNRGLPARLAALDAGKFPLAGREHLAPHARSESSLTEIIDQLQLDEKTRAEVDRWLKQRADRLRAARSILREVDAEVELVSGGPGMHGITARAILNGLDNLDLELLVETLEPLQISREDNVISVPTDHEGHPLRLAFVKAAELSDGPIERLLEPSPTLVVAAGRLPDSTIHADERHVVTPSELVRGLVRVNDRMGADDPGSSKFGEQLYRHFFR